MSNYLRKASNPVLLRSIAAVAAAEATPVAGAFTVLNDSQWDKTKSKLVSSSLFRKWRAVFTPLTKGNADNTCTISFWAKDAAGDIMLLATTAVIANQVAVLPLELGDAFNASLAVTISAIGGTTPAITTKVKLVGYNPNLDN